MQQTACSMATVIVTVTFVHALHQHVNVTETIISTVCCTSTMCCIATCSCTVVYGVTGVTTVDLIPPANATTSDPGIQTLIPDPYLIQATSTATYPRNASVIR